MKVDYHAKAKNSAGLIKDLFVNLLKAASADQGFIALEDDSDHLAFVACLGEYFYLSKDVGVTGHVVRTGEPKIVKDPSAVKDPDFKDTSNNVKSEIIFPIKKDNRVIGAILLDRTLRREPFKTHHFDLLSTYAEEIASIISDDEPWSFWRWWNTQLARKRNLLFSEAEGLSETILADLRAGANGQSKSMVEIRIHRIASGENLEPVGQPIGDMISATDDVRSLVASVTRGGVPFLDKPTTIDKNEAIFALPSDGPVLGILRIATPKREPLTKKEKSHIARQIAAIKFHHFAPHSAEGEYGAEYYFDLVRIAYETHKDPAGIQKTLADIVKRTEKLCGGSVKLEYETKGFDQVTTESVNVIPHPKDELRAREARARREFGRTCAILTKDLDSLTGDSNAIYCAIHARKELRAVMTIDAQNSVTAHISRDIAESIAMIIARVIETAS